MISGLPTRDFPLFRRSVKMLFDTAIIQRNSSHLLYSFSFAQFWRENLARSIFGQTDKHRF
jgi:hypothetical protein